jgi:hypothetical protein
MPREANGHTESSIHRNVSKFPTARIVAMGLEAMIPRFRLAADRIEGRADVLLSCVLAVLGRASPFDGFTWHHADSTRCSPSRFRWTYDKAQLMASVIT